jgi:hypothetical protein
VLQEGADDGRRRCSEGESEEAAGSGGVKGREGGSRSPRAGAEPGARVHVNALWTAIVAVLRPMLRRREGEA